VFADLKYFSLIIVSNNLVLGRIKELRKGETNGERGVPAYNDGLRDEPQRVSGQAPRQGGQLAKPPEAERYSAFERHMEVAKLPSYPYFAVSKTSRESSTTASGTDRK